MTDYAASIDESQPGEDKVTVGATQETRAVLDKLVADGHYRTSLGAFQALAVLAIRAGLKPSTEGSSGGTMWNRGSVNPQVLAFLQWYLPTSRPVRALELYGNAGARLVELKSAEGVYTLSEIFQVASLPPAGE